MQLRFTYIEIQDMIAAKTGKQLPMSYCDDHTIHIGYEVNVLFKTTTVGLDITVDSIEGENIYLSYGGGMGIEFMVRTALSQVKNQPGGDMIEALDGCRILVRLGKNEQLSPIFERIELKDIHFDAETVMIDFVPKAGALV